MVPSSAGYARASSILIEPELPLSASEASVRSGSKFLLSHSLTVRRTSSWRSSSRPERTQIDPVSQIPGDGAQLTAGSRIPQTHASVEVARDQTTAIEAECHRVD
jgi:hypothetical protein